MIGRRAVLAGALAAMGAGADGAVPVEMRSGLCVVEVTLGGAPARMILDTGAERSVLTVAAVARLGLALDPWVGTTLQGAGGRLEQHRNAVVRSASLGDLGLFQRRPGDSLSFPVTTLSLDGADGLLGGDLLRRFVLDLDVPGGRLVVSPAPGGPAPAGAVRLGVLRRDLLLAPVTLDGFGLTALVDTGASGTLVNARGMHRLGLTAARMAQDGSVPTTGLGGRFEPRLHRFRELRVGKLVIAAPDLLVAQVPEPVFDLILGLDVLGRQRLRLCYQESWLNLG